MKNIPYASFVETLMYATKGHMLTYRKINHIDVIINSEVNFSGYTDTRKSIFGCVYFGMVDMMGIVGAKY